MFLGYMQNHTGGTYRMINIRTNYIVLNRDVICLNKTYKDYTSREKIPRQTPISYKMKTISTKGIT